ncbi:hypothetical protein [Rhodococcus rhodochrous]|uniref:Uncharacterized protein n=1 Tax=Rhodococcus rhodochrous KG-21 TaxID=1441923 RepID=A0A0M8PKQ9_RHORH|nr:hypothetical protein [Rhodococcus rhodochrous]KOS53668.1 hypothetical protein Z051_24245 [Rhodococcus rhodochrous KG-21]
MDSAASYVRKQAVVTGLVNVVVNPLLAWAGKRGTSFVPLWSADGIVVDIALTAIILSVLVAWFSAAGVRRALRAGLDAADAPRAGRWLARLPSGASALGLSLGVAAAVVSVVVIWVLHLLGVSGLSTGWFLVLKAVYGGVLGYLVARWVIVRQLSATRAAPIPGSTDAAR